MARLRQIARRTVELEGGPGRAELSIVLADDRLVQQLNRQYRQADAPTDVLAFPAGEPPGPGLPQWLGEVVISIPTAQRQAAQAGHEWRAELDLLVVHGVLHLLGWNDHTPATRRRMMARQAEILAVINREHD